ncbi:hypothetical protein TNCV_2441761 [Trichonephila clavipes]|nr:hypothetical protein TNCV_2441761 [Trichonephila clavipes]
MATRTINQLQHFPRKLRMLLKQLPRPRLLGTSSQPIGRLSHKGPSTSGHNNGPFFGNHQLVSPIVRCWVLPPTEHVGQADTFARLSQLDPNLF